MNDEAEREKVDEVWEDSERTAIVVHSRYVCVRVCAHACLRVGGYHIYPALLWGSMF